MDKTIIILLIYSILISCSNKEKINSITIASNGCHGECPVFALELDKYLNAKYYGGDFSKNKGYYTAEISKETWNKITDKILKTDLDQIDSIYDKNNDFDYYEIIISTKRPFKTRGFLIDMPADLQQIIKNILNVQNQLKLIGSNDSLSFETNLQNLEKLKVSNPKFLPPGN